MMNSNSQYVHLNRSTVASMITIVQDAEELIGDEYFRRQSIDYLFFDVIKTIMGEIFDGDNLYVNNTVIPKNTLTRLQVQCRDIYQTYLALEALIEHGSENTFRVQYASAVTATHNKPLDVYKLSTMDRPVELFEPVIMDKAGRVFFQISYVTPSFVKAFITEYIQLEFSNQPGLSADGRAFLALCERVTEELKKIALGNRTRFEDPPYADEWHLFQPTL